MCTIDWIAAPSCIGATAPNHSFRAKKGGAVGVTYECGASIASIKEGCSVPSSFVWIICPNLLSFMKIHGPLGNRGVRRLRRWVVNRERSLLLPREEELSRRLLAYGSRGVSPFEES